MTIFQELEKKSSLKRKKTSEAFFKVGKDSYSKGDVFVGISMPDLREIAKANIDISALKLSQLIKSKYHEYRMCGFLILVFRYKKADQKTKKYIYLFCLRNIKYINNWDIVDVIIPSIVGDYFFKERTELPKIETLSKSKNLWRKRISILACFPLVKNKEFKIPLNIAFNLLADKEDLIQKALGWMLREVYKQDPKQLEIFLDKYYDSISRTTLRYAIERMEESKRIKYLNKNKILHK